MDRHSAVVALAALAHEHRLAAYRFLAEAGSDGLSAGVIADRLSLAPSSLTFHHPQLLHRGSVTPPGRPSADLRDGGCCLG